MTEEQDKKDATIIARIPKDLKERIKAKASDMNKNISEIVRLMAEKFLK